MLGSNHRSFGRSCWEQASVDVELVALRIPERDRGVVHTLDEVLTQVTQQRGAELTEPPSLGVHALLSRLDRQVSTATGVDIDVEPIVRGLAVRHDLDPNAGAATVGIDDAVGSPTEPGLGQSHVATPVVPGGEIGRWRLEHVAQGLGPETSQRLRVADAINNELVSDGHGSPRLAHATSRPQCQARVTSLCIKLTITTARRSRDVKA